MRAARTIIFRGILVVWFLAFTKPQCEYQAVERIRQQGFGAYLPELIEDRRRKPLFPRYVFVESEGLWRFLIGTGGVSHPVMRGSEPALVPPAIIEELHMREQNGVIVLERKAFALDQQVRLRNGAFAGHLALWKGQSSRERQRILLEFMGKAHMVEVAPGDIEAV